MEVEQRHVILSNHEVLGLFPLPRCTAVAPGPCGRSAGSEHKGLRLTGESLPFMTKCDASCGFPEVLFMSLKTSLFFLIYCGSL